MNRELIEKAAGEYSGSVLGFKDNPVVMANHKAFTAGADWRINSVWHDATEKPKFGATKGVWIVRYFEHGMLSTTFVRKDEWYELRKSNNFTKWAYQEDLFPERKEDKQ